MTAYCLLFYVPSLQNLSEDLTVLAVTVLQFMMTYAVTGLQCLAITKNKKIVTIQ